MLNKILLVDDDPLNLDLLEQELEDLGYTTARASSGPEALTKIDTAYPNLVLLDYQMPGMNGIEVLREIRATAPDLPVVIVTAFGTIERAVDAMKAGANDFITKPFDSDHLALVVKRALERLQLKSEMELLSRELGGRYQLVAGQSAEMARAIEDAQKAAQSKSTVLLLGESGTGKEIFARAIHTWSGRNAGPFAAINCVGLSRELLESELFGHEKGAFTGAHQLKKGKIELANGGTVFLDEVGDISSELQAKLLRFLQEREFERVGGTQTLPIDVRIIAATNRELEAAVRGGTFREDLFHRLNVIAIVLPPLRDRKEDVPPLVDHFLERFSLETKKKFDGIAPPALERLMAYAWPGNVRELANVIERAVVLGEGPTLNLSHLPSRIVGREPNEESRHENYHAAMEAHRRLLIKQALVDAQGNRAAAAKALGLHRTHLLKLMKTLGID